MNKQILCAALAAVGVGCLGGCEERSVADGAARDQKAHEHIAHIRESANRDELNREQQAQQDIAREKHAAAADRDRALNRDRPTDIQEAPGVERDRTVVRDSRATDLNRSDLNRLDARPHAEVAAGPSATFTGSLKSAATGLLDSKIVLRNAKNAELSLKTDDQTRILENGRLVRLRDFREGTEVRASYVIRGDENIARDVQILRPVVK